MHQFWTKILHSENRKYAEVLLLQTCPSSAQSIGASMRGACFDLRPRTAKEKSSLHTTWYDVLLMLLLWFWDPSDCLREDESRMHSFGSPRVWNVPTDGPGGSPSRVKAPQVSDLVVDPTPVEGTVVLL